ncbi:MAG: D-cysteine desulfhydrase family protein [Bryobacterales bacterium]|nr:D-cysteine desulfhydrase family protein [Bryobacterales bacterium]
MHPIDRNRAIARFEEIPRLALGHYPTPVEKLPRLRAALGGGPKIYIKRDDYTGPGFGGNKVRKLEYMLAAAQSEGANAVITCGGEKSNHCRVTAALAARLGLECTLVLNGGGGSPKPASLAVDEWFGAHVERVQGREERAPRMEAVAAELRAKGRQPAIIPLGASTPLGAMGFVSAAAELAAQMDRHEWKLDAIYFSSSSGGTHAGLTAGRALFLAPETELVGVSADDPSGSIQSTVESILLGVGEKLGFEMEGDIRVLDDYVGAGYGIESEAGREALELVARTEGILLDPVYTAKAMAGLIDQIRKQRYSESQSVLFWHTGGQLALFHV